MLTISTPPWRGGPMPGWSSSMPAGKKNIFGSQERSKAFFKYQIPNTQVRLLSEPFAHFQGDGDRNGKLARSYQGIASFFMFKIEITTKYVIQLQNWENKGANCMICFRQCGLNAIKHYPDAAFYRDLPFCFISHWLHRHWRIGPVRRRKFSGRFF